MQCQIASPSIARRVRCADIQELGVCSVVDIEGIELDDIGVTGTAALGARGLYGNALATGSVWYASYNEDAVRRCFKDLKSNHHIGWTCTDQIKVVVDLDKWRIKFFMNGQRVCMGLLPQYMYRFANIPINTYTVCT